MTRSVLARPQLGAAAVLLALALGARLSVLALAGHVHPASDGLLYDEAARSLAGLPHSSGRCLCDAVFYRGFGYPGLLSVVYRITTNYEAVRALQALVWVAAALIVFVTAARISGTYRALAIALVVTLEPSILKFFLFLLTESVVTLLAVGSIAVLVLLAPRWPALASALYAVLVGALAVSHSGWQLYPLLAIPALAIFVGTRRALLSGAITVLTGLVIVTPFHVLHPGQPWTLGKGGAGFGAGGAWTFFVGSRPGSDGNATPLDYALAEGNASAARAAKRSGALDPAIAGRVAPRGRLRLTDGDYRSAAVMHFTANPGGVSLLAVKKVWRQFTDADDIDSRQPAYQVRVHPLDRLFTTIDSPLLVVLTLGGLGGLLLMLRERRWRLAVAIGMPVAYVAVVFAALGVPELRYAFPALHALAIATAYLIAPRRMRDATPLQCRAAEPEHARA